MSLKDEIRQRLIAQWSSEPELAVGVPYRSMASEAAEIVEALLVEKQEVIVASLSQ